MTLTRSIETALVDLTEMLSYRRPHNSKSERRFINRFFRQFNPQFDDYGNFWVKNLANPTILWSAHTDTVHRIPGRQRITCTEAGEIALAKGEPGCLGADNGAGCWLLREMLLAGVPGLYVFHRDEEGGCRGSGKLAAQQRDGILKGIEAAIAFDRRGTKSVITHQMGGRTCSEEFANSVAALLGLGHAPDPTGAFTDTSSYSNFIPECSNVSVGYLSEHSSSERLDTVYLGHLRDAAIAADWSKIAIARKPGEDDLWSSYEGGPWGWGGGSGYGRSGFQGNFDFDEAPTMEELISDYPDEVADLLRSCGISDKGLADYLEEVNPASSRRRGKRWL